MRQSAGHQLVPGVLIACLCGVLQEDIVAHRLDGHQAQSTGEGFILRDRDILRWQTLSQAWGFLPCVHHYGFFHMPVDALLRAKGGAHKPIKPRHLRKETDQANATRTDFDKHHM